MGIFGYLWQGSREDVASLGQASRPDRPGALPKLSPEEARRAQLAYLDRNGSKQLSDERYAQLQELLKAAQARPVGAANKLRKNKKKIKR